VERKIINSKIINKITNKMGLRYHIDTYTSQLNIAKGYLSTKLYNRKTFFLQKYILNIRTKIRLLKI